MNLILPECMRCEFYEPQDDLVGECRRMSPRPMPAVGLDLSDPDAMMALWPTVTQDDWCGEYQEASRNRAVRNASLTRHRLEDAQARLARRPDVTEDLESAEELDDVDARDLANGEDTVDET